MERATETERLRDAIQDVLFFGGRLSTKHETAEFAAAMGEAIAAIDGLPAEITAGLEALAGPAWKARLRLKLASYHRACKNRGQADTAGLVEAQDQLWAVGSQPATAAAEGEPAANGKDEPTVNSRMYATLGTKPESQAWSAQQWATHLECCKSSVAESPAWQSLKVVKASAKIEAGARPADRRRKSK